MRKLSYLAAVNEALDQGLALDDRVYLLGEDIGIYGGGFGATKGLVEKYGEKRVRSTPISESAIAGIAVGSAMTGMRPVLELQFSDFITIAMDQLVNQAAKIHYMYGGRAQVPLVMRTAGGAGTGAAAQHSQSLENWLAHIPGLKVVQPSSAYDAKGLLLSALQDNNPVMIYEHKLLYPLMEEVPIEPYTIPLGKAAVKKVGTQVTVIATGFMVQQALKAATELEQSGLSVEVIDPRTLVPLDTETILKSVAKTKRVVIVTEAVKRSGFGSEIAACIAENPVMQSLKAPIVRIGGEAVPIPCQKELEQRAIPQVATIMAAVEKIVAAEKEPMMHETY